MSSEITQELASRETLEKFREAVLELLESFSDESGNLKYRERVSEALRRGRRSVAIDFMDIYAFNEDLAKFLRNEPLRAIKEIFQPALDSYVRSEFNVEVSLKPRFRQLPESYRIRDLRNEHLEKLIQIDGIVVRMTPPKQRISRAVFVHSECGGKFEVEVDREYFEMPRTCPLCQSSKGSFEMIEEENIYVDYQKIVVSEMPEEIPPGHMPRQLTIVLEEDLVDIARPGDRVSITGVLRLARDRAVSRKRAIRSVYDAELYASNIELSHKGIEQVELTERDIEEIRRLARDPMIRRRIIASIAPTIYGLWDIKEAIALLLFGGVPKYREDGTRVRGDIHVLIIGDPGTAKSQLLQFTSKIAPRGIFTTGRGSTAAGLTASVLRDKTTGEYYLEAGALVLGDLGVVCIDEIDKMREEDRVAIHEALEQQTVSISKAGIHATLNARASVLAAGNPKYGRYEDDRHITDNINLPVTILSRFDLIFVLKDKPSPEEDRRLASYIVEAHSRYDEIKPSIDPQLLKKYIAYARTHVKPVLSDEARKMLVDFFVEMRRAAAESKGSTPISITARQMESLIRLAEAHARMALKEVVDVEDASEAIRMMLLVLSNVGLDIETKEIDIDSIMTGKPLSKRRKIHEIEDVIRQITKIEGKTCAPLNEIINRLQQQNIPQEEIERLLNTLYREGIVSQVKIHCYRLVE
ncbi:MAG: minichromosome maintenance protein MCM [Sulfolobales archaeon]